MLLTKYLHTLLKKDQVDLKISSKKIKRHKSIPPATKEEKILSKQTLGKTKCLN